MTARALPARRPLLLAGLGALGCALLAMVPGEVGPLAARAGLVALGLGVVVVLAGRRAGGRPAAAVLRVTARAALGRSAIAVVEVDGRRFLVGGGERSLELLAELEPLPGPPRWDPP